MSDVVTLNNISINENCMVVCLKSNGIMRRRLMDIGLVPGSIVCPVLSSPSGNPRAYLIKGSVVAIRNDDASKVEVKRL